MPSSLSRIYATGRRHLGRCDPILKTLMDRVGPCTLQPHADGFAVLTKSIISQMISTKAAISIGAKLSLLLGKKGITPATLLAAGEENVRSVGLSRTKASALLDLAQRATDGRLPLTRFPDMSDEEVLDDLVAVRGIGPWTAQMFLIFCLGRLDVLPVDDFGLRAGVQQTYSLAELPARKALREMGEPWRPYRSLATWYFWRSRGGVPQSDKPRLASAQRKT
jgi:DNA-3-methyladenine glycosylase II